LTTRPALAEKPEIIDRQTPAALSALFSPLIEPIIPAMKNKTLATWLSLALGPLGLNRFYMFGLKDAWGWVLVVMTFLGLYGFERADTMGLDDPLSWWLLPILGLTIAASALHALAWGLMSAETWNQRYNPDAEPLASAGLTNWFTIIALVLSMMVGTTAMLSSLAYGFQRYFESQITETDR
jgi:tellurite resistance protein TehA-like permease